MRHQISAPFLPTGVITRPSLRLAQRHRWGLSLPVHLLHMMKVGDDLMIKPHVPPGLRNPGR